MRKVTFILSFVLIVLTLTSCETVHYFAIDTQVPAEVTFPISHPRIVVVNNAVIQSADAGVKHSIKSKQVDYPLPKDSAHWACIDYIGKMLDMTQYFEDVLIYNYSLREDQSFLSPLPISPENVKEITNDADADILISVDRLLFDVTQTIEKKFSDQYHFLSTDIICGGVFSVYTPEKEKSLVSFSFTDTLSFGNFVNLDSALIFQELPQRRLYSASKNLAGKLTLLLAPYWERSERVIYSGLDTSMKHAFAYSTKDKWEDAIDIWKNVYQNNKNLKQRGKAATNIALAEEMRDNFDAALEWIEKALTVYTQEKPGKVKKEHKAALQYKETLEKRKILQEKLNLQYR